MKLLNSLYETIKLTFGNYPKLHFTQDYDNYWTAKRGKKIGKLTEFQKNRLKEIIPYLKKSEKILDVGSGDGGIPKYLKEKTKVEITCTDISKTALTNLNKLGFTTEKLDLNNLSDIKKLKNYDRILALEILEHLKNPEEVLLELQKKGKVIFSVPNTGFIGHRFRLLFGSFPLQWELNPGEHLRYWTKRDMKWWLKSLKLKHKIIMYEGIPLLNKLWPGMFARGIIVVL